MRTVVPEQKICIKCDEEKDIDQFEFRKDIQKYRNVCIFCVEKRRRELHPKTRRVGTEKSKTAYNKDYYAQNKDSVKEQQRKYRIENKSSIRQYNNKLENNKRRTDPSFRLRKDCSRTVLAALKVNGGSKCNYSIMEYLPYSIAELKEHLEKQFESWMTWDNQGSYRRDSYRESDMSTWTWQINHIIPQSALPYSSMTDDNFRRCWLLNNLRPLKSIDNLKKGSK